MNIELIRAQCRRWIFISIQRLYRRAPCENAGSRKLRKMPQITPSWFLACARRDSMSPTFSFAYWITAEIKKRNPLFLRTTRPCRCEMKINTVSQSSMQMHFLSVHALRIGHGHLIFTAVNKCRGSCRVYQRHPFAL